jgi:hypothetical protein
MAPAAERSFFAAGSDRSIFIRARPRSSDAPLGQPARTDTERGANIREFARGSGFDNEGLLVLGLKFMLD